MENEDRITLESLKIEYEVSDPTGAVDRGWPHLAYVCKFTRKGRSVEFDYKMAIGHVNWQGRPRFPFSSVSDESGDMERLFYVKQKNPYASFKNKELELKVAVFLAKQQGVEPDGLQVLNAACRDGLNARDMAFDDFCRNFGYDTDSRRAEAIYLACQEQWTKVLKILFMEEAVDIGQMEF